MVECPDSVTLRVTRVLMMVTGVGPIDLLVKTRLLGSVIGQQELHRFQQMHVPPRSNFAWYIIYVIPPEGLCQRREIWLVCL